jgi:hypothetical protein
VHGLDRLAARWDSLVVDVKLPCPERSRPVAMRATDSLLCGIRNSGCNAGASAFDLGRKGRARMRRFSFPSTEERSRR